MNRLASLVIAFLMIVLCAGCGGSGHSTSASGPGSLMTSAQRATIIDNVTAAIAPLTQTGGLWNPTQLVAALNSVSGISNVQAQAGGTIIAQFSDGVPLTVFNDISTSSATPSIKPQLASSPQTVPASGNVVWEDAFSNPPSYAPQNFTNGGYAVASPGTASVPALQALGNSAIGVLTLVGHGGPCNVYGGKVASFSIWTSTPVTQASIDQYSTSLFSSNPTLGVAVAANFANGGKPESHFCILPQFITANHWRFSDNSFVFLDCCGSGSTSAQALQQALFGANASVVAGWTDVSELTPDYNAISFLYGQMLGVGLSRPYSLAASLQIGNAQGITAYSFSDSFFSASFHPVLAVFTNPVSTGASFTALEPLITSSSLSGSTLTLAGEFGVPGAADTTVSVAGAQASDVSVTSAGLTCTLPSSATGSVPVFVQVATQDGRTLTSNTVTIDVTPEEYETATFANVTFVSGANTVVINGSLTINTSTEVISNDTFTVTDTNASGPYSPFTPPIPLASLQTELINDVYGTVVLLTFFSVPEPGVYNTPSSILYMQYGDNAGTDMFPWVYTCTGGSITVTQGKNGEVRGKSHAVGSEAASKYVK